MREKYIEECAIIHQNCTYTAEAHHLVAATSKRRGFWLQIVPAICAAVSSAFVAAGYAPNGVLVFTLLSATTSAVAAVLNPNLAYQEHLAAAKSFTALKHDARFLRDAHATKLSDEGLVIAVENLHNRYNELLKTVPPTEEKYFLKARQSIQRGFHEADLDESGNIK